MFRTIIVGTKGEPGDAAALALAELLGDAATVTQVQVPHGEPVGRRLHEAATEGGADLIVVGSSTRGTLGRILAGDDVIATLRGAPCTVAVAPHGFDTPARSVARIGVGYDGSPEAQAALATARELAGEGAEVCALAVATPAQGRVTALGAVTAIEAKRDATERCIAQLDPAIEGHAVDGIAHQKLAELSTEVDLLVVGSSVRGRMGRVRIGSTSETLSREAACPLLVVAAPASAG